MFNSDANVFARTNYDAFQKRKIFIYFPFSLSEILLLITIRMKTFHRSLFHFLPSAKNRYFSPQMIRFNVYDIH